MITQKELSEWDNPGPIDWLAEAKKIETAEDYIRFADAAVESVAKEVDRLRAENAAAQSDIERLVPEVNALRLENAALEERLQTVGQAARDAMSERDRLRAENAELREALTEARKTMRNAWGAISTNQIEDKQVGMMLENGFKAIDALRARAAKEGDDVKRKTVKELKAEIAWLEDLLNDEAYIEWRASYARGEKSWANMINERHDPDSRMNRIRARAAKEGT